ncbi:hypothetical protein BBH99_09165 [Chryseobacterium contaminans]|uniref:Uncharacterized protein n=1 Tax=Chryseobacterium contaminans TaxID=1423959 RepID=A0A1M7FD36_9FLAO|nr:hypothetical protein [Chryseobacterium contaminans]OCA78220.1 hypothetical protein BBH99_09165 [Chryseobacterium contaminans]SHM01994.1 hypothetical protein SAMN05444407_108195 [Chryseobacterium contaminans]
MKNLKKVSRVQLKEVQGGVLPGMRRCVDPQTCQLRIWWIGGFEESSCTASYSFCAPLDYYPPGNGDTGTIHVAN